MKKVEYAEAPHNIEKAIDKSQSVPDFLPPPSELIRKIEKENLYDYAAAVSNTVSD
jgi:hypothetical protein